MAIIGVTWSIEHDDGYSERWDALYDVLRQHGLFEKRTTSCAFLETDESVEQVRLALYGVLDYKKDKAIVFQTYRHLMEAFGPS